MRALTPPEGRRAQEAPHASALNNQTTEGRKSSESTAAMSPFHRAIMQRAGLIPEDTEGGEPHEHC